MSNAESDTCKDEGLQASNFSISEITSLLPILVAICYVIGWSYARSYFREIGMPWGVDVVGSEYFLYSSAIIIPMFISGLLLVNNSYIEIANSFKRIGVWLYLSAMIVIGVGLVFEGTDITYRVNPWVLLGSVLVLSIAFGLEFGRMYKIALKKDSIKVQLDVAVLMMMSFSIGLPLLLGGFSAEVNMSEKDAIFSTTQLTNKDTWYVIYGTGEKIILLSVDKENNKKFRVVSPDGLIFMPPKNK